tara:strand:- start:754 stop:2268 length:1515 start_codon:yes stop_codon:yes gene_type:complete
MLKIKNRGPNYKRSFDTNNDGKADLFHIVRDYKLFRERADRNYDGKMDYQKTCENSVCTVIADDDFNGSFERSVTTKPNGRNSISETYKNKKTKRSYQVSLNNAEIQRDTEGQVVECKNCQIEKVELKPAEECDGDDLYDLECTNEIVFNKVSPQLKQKYFNLFSDIKNGPQLLMSESCRYSKDYHMQDIAEETKKAMKTMISCFDKMAQANNKYSQGAARNLALSEKLLTNKDNPLKLHCWDKSKEKRSAYAVGVEERMRSRDQKIMPFSTPSFQKELREREYSPDELNSINLANVQSEMGTVEITRTIIHEFLHLISDNHTHGYGAEPYLGCALSCTKDLYGGELSGDVSKSYDSCYSELEPREGGRLSLATDQEYSLMMSTMEMLKDSTGSAQSYAGVIAATLLRESATDTEGEFKLSELQKNMTEEISDILIREAYKALGPKAPKEGLRAIIDKYKGKEIPISKAFEWGSIVSALVFAHSSTVFTEEHHTIITNLHTRPK